MKALLLFEPLFQYVCEVNRLSRNGFPREYAEVRKEILNRMSEISDRADADVELREHFRVLKTPVIFAIDDLLVENRNLPWWRLWNDKRLGFVKDGLAGSEAFFVEYLDPALKAAPSLEGAEQMLVYYVCLGIGFQGYLFDQPEKLRAYMKAMRPAVAQWLVDDRVEHLLPQAYLYTNRRELARPPELKWALLLAGVVAILLMGLPLYWWMATDLINQMERNIDLREINESNQGLPWSANTLKKS